MTLERAYQQWRAAVIAQDARAWAGAITQYRQVVTRNMIVSQRKAFPRAVFEVPIDPPDVAGLQLLEVQAVGETAHLLYFGKVDGGEDASKAPESVLMVKFFNERGGWKFDSTKLLSLQDRPEVLTQIKSGRTSEFLDYPEFTPPGNAPAVPALCDVPDHVAGSTLQSFGYEATMRINGFDYPIVQDSAQKMFVLGGLKNGVNDVSVTVKRTDIPAGEKRLLQLDFFVLTGVPNKPPVRVFHYESESNDLTGFIKMPVVITDEVLSQGR